MDIFVIYVLCLSIAGWETALLYDLVCDVFLYYSHFPMCCPGSSLVLDCIDS